MYGAHAGRNGADPSIGTEGRPIVTIGNGMYRRGQMLVIANPLDGALNTSRAGKPTYRERRAAARDDQETNNLSVKALARAAAAMWQTGRENYTAMETIK